jgi:pilus assembly protein CpaE
MAEITVLIVDDNEAKAQNITKLLQFEKDIKVLEIAHTGEEGIARYHELKPDIVLMDTNLPDKHGFLVTTEIVAADPSAQVIFSALDPLTDLTEKAMDAGAAGFIVRPIDDGAKVVEKIRRAAERGRKLRMGTAPLPPPPEPKPVGKIVAVYGVRGGSGCTTIATNLALSLQSENTPTVLVDAHRQFGDVAAFLNTQARYTLDDLAPQIDKLDAETIREMLSVHENGLAVLPGPASPEGGEEITAEGFQRLLEVLDYQYAYTIIDFAAHLDDVALTALGKADLIIIVLTPDIPAIKNARLFLTTLEHLSISAEPPLFILNQTDRRVGLQRDTVSKALRFPIALEIPYEREATIEAINRGDPLMAARKPHPLGKSFQELTAQVRERLLAKEPV